MKLLKTVKYEGEMELLSGLAIKGSNNDLNIGGADSEVIKNPVTKMPYVPGSSLKFVICHLNQGILLKKRQKILLTAIMVQLEAHV